MQALSSTACPTLLQDAHMDPRLPRSNHKNAHCTRLRYVQQYHVCNAMSAVYTQIAKKLLCLCAMVGDEPVVLLDPYILFKLGRRRNPAAHVPRVNKLYRAGTPRAHTTQQLVLV